MINGCYESKGFCFAFPLIVPIAGFDLLHYHWSIFDLNWLWQSLPISLEYSLTRMLYLELR